MKKKQARRVKNDGRGILGEADLKCLKLKNFVF